MYSPHRLDTPPPASRFRRPWSPEPFDPDPRAQNNEGPAGAREGGAQRREASDYSVEALDLADYAHTLSRQADGHRQAAFAPYSAYPLSPRPVHSLSSASTSTPPLLSSHPSTSQSQSAASSRSRAALRGTSRGFSFPIPSTSSQSSRGPLVFARPPTATAQERDNMRSPTPGPDSEIDIAQFPAFARGWYAKPAGAYDPSSQHAPFRVDPFDPSFPTNEYNAYPTPPPLYASPRNSLGDSQTSRGGSLVPWGGDQPDGRPLDPGTKEERMRMLEREFAGHKNHENADEEEHRIGSVDSKGQLITAGPKKRAFTRWLEALLALLAAGSSIYAAVAIKSKTPPPPASKPPAYVLYGLSVVTFLLTAYLFIIYPCCCGRRRRKAAGAQFSGGTPGMMVLPVQGPPGGKSKKNKKDPKGGDGVQVNLIVDPGMFNHDLDEDDEDEETSESEQTIPGTYSERSRRSRRRRRAAKRRSIFAGLAVEAQWKHARAMLKWGMAADVLMVFAWAAEFGYILIGKRCPSGGFNGWCDAYNLATAASCLLCVAFGFSIFFDIKDLHASNMSPRTRTSRA